MQEKQKITLYIPPGLHRQLKIRSAIDSESMSALVEKAVSFYIKHSDIVEETGGNNHGKTHQVHVCPECNAAMVLKEGEMVSLRNQPSVIEEGFPIEITETVNNKSKAETKAQQSKGNESKGNESKDNDNKLTETKEQEKLVHC